MASARRTIRSQDGSHALKGTVCLESYIAEVVDCLDPNYTMTVNEKHRKSMFRCLLDIGKPELDQHLRDTAARVKFERSKHFIDCCLLDLKPPSDRAPNYETGLLSLSTHQATPSKFFSYLAGGRRYKGKFERLLDEVEPSLISTYHSVVAEPGELELLKLYAQESDVKPEIKTKLFQCLENPLGRAPSQPADGGRSLGIKGEIDLDSFLKQRVFDGKRQIRLNVLVKPSGRSLKTPHNCLLEVSPGIIKDGLTSEFDAIVLHLTADCAQILEVWEAKACLHATTIEDILAKKVPSLNLILSDPQTKLIIDGKRFPITGSFPIVGIFSTSILNPEAAARRIQYVLCENRLETDKRAVDEALVSGLVHSFDGALRMNEILALVKKNRPIVVVSSLFH
jgi:hypothetical protein